MPRLLWITKAHWSPSDRLRQNIVIFGKYVTSAAEEVTDFGHQLVLESLRNDFGLML
jgi:hypothetical protein